MMIIGLILAALSALLHVYIFYMESFAWTSKRVRATFGTTEASAAATRELAFNQGFYNLFLALSTGIGITIYLFGDSAVGITLVLVGVGSMTAAALVLLLSSPKKWVAALTQGVVPALSALLITLDLIR